MEINGDNRLNHAATMLVELVQDMHLLYIYIMHVHRHIHLQLHVTRPV